MSLIKVIVLADDFTGALDTGVQFAMTNLPTEVLLWTDFLSRAKSTTPVEKGFQDVVTVLDTESRHLPREAAYDRLLNLTRTAVSQGYETFYKKTDSTLRGAIGAEMQGMLDALPHQQLHFLPAYPGMGRQTLAGKQYVHGIPLHETEFGTDPLNPIQTAYVSDLLTAQGFKGTVHVAAEITDTSIGEPPDMVPGLMAERKTVVVHDARDQADLVAAGGRLAGTQSLKLTAGCAGFAAVLADYLHKRLLPRHVAINTSEIRMPVSQQTLLLCGSTSDVSLAQIRTFSARHPDISVHTLSGEEKESQFWQSDTGEQRLGRIRDCLEKDAFYIIQSVQHRRDRDEHVDAGAVAAVFGTITQKVLARCPALNLIVFGGDTVYGIMNTLPDATLRPVCEIGPGIVASTLSGETATRLMITKAGGFGEPNAVEDMLGYIKDRATTADGCSSATERGNNAY